MGNTECSLCPAGKFSEIDAADKCLDCKAGTAAEVDGKSSSLNQSVPNIWSGYPKALWIFNSYINHIDYFESYLWQKSHV